MTALTREQALKIIKSAHEKGEKPDLSGVKNLVGADLAGTDLSGTNFSGADLSGADLSQADLSGTDLSRADLSGTNLKGAKYNQDTKWPKGYDPIKAKAIRED